MNIIYTTNGIILPQIPKQIQRKSPPPPNSQTNRAHVISLSVFNSSSGSSTLSTRVVEINYLFINKYVLAQQITVISRKYP